MNSTVNLLKYDTFFVLSEFGFVLGSGSGLVLRYAISITIKIEQVLIYSFLFSKLLLGF